MPGPERTDGAPRRAPVPRDDRGEAGHGDGEQDRAIRVPGAEVDQREPGDGVRDEPGWRCRNTRTAVARSSSTRAAGVRLSRSLWPCPAKPEPICTNKVSATVVSQGSRRTPSRAPGYHQGARYRHIGAPSHAGSAPGPRSCCSSMTATLDGGQRGGRPPGVVIRRTPGGVRAGGAIRRESGRPVAPEAVRATGHTGGRAGDRSPRRQCGRPVAPQESARPVDPKAVRGDRSARRESGQPVGPEAVRAAGQPRGRTRGRSAQGEQDDRRGRARRAGGLRPGGLLAEDCLRVPRQAALDPRAAPVARRRDTSARGISPNGPSRSAHGPPADVSVPVPRASWSRA